MKMLWILAGVGFSCLLGATIWLAILNWSERLYIPFIASVLVGVATGFFSILSTLKRDVEQRNIHYFGTRKFRWDFTNSYCGGFRLFFPSARRRIALNDMAAIKSQ